MEKSHTIQLSEALSVFGDHRPDIRKACVENIKAITLAHQPAKEMTDDDEMTVDNIWQHLNHLAITEKTEPMLRVIKRIDGQKRARGGSDITDAMIEHAREYPIMQLFKEQTGQSVRHKMAQCPFHPDKTASMSFGKHNRYNCFGCDAKGDTIDLYMKLNGVNFIQAVKELQ